jgi:hypothetical protein
VILWHASRRPVRKFVASGIGLGWEPNSALGVWLSRDPEIAASYLREEDGWLHRVEVPDGLRLAAAHDRHAAIWGGPDLTSMDREIAYPMFEAARRDLSGLGFDGVWCEMPGTDLDASVCLFDVRRIRISERIRVTSRDVLPEVEGDDTSDVHFGVNLEDALGRAGAALPEPT